MMAADDPADGRDAGGRATEGDAACRVTDGRAIAAAIASARTVTAGEAPALRSEGTDSPTEQEVMYAT